MKEGDEEPSAAQATSLGLHCQLTALAKSLLWLSGMGAAAMLLTSDFHPTAFFLAFLCLVFLLFLTSWWLGRTALRCLVPSALQPATGFTWDLLPIRFGLHHVGDHIAARDVLLLHGSEGNQRGIFGYRAHIAPGANMWVDGSLRLPRRGRFLQHRLRLVSTFPFGLLRWTAAWEVPADILSFPRLGALRDAQSLIPAERETLSTGAGRFTDTEEFHTLKRWRPGMSQRLVHWKSTARRGHTMIREMHGVRSPRLRIEVLAPLSPANFDSRRLQFEQAICLAATLADFFLRRNYHVELACLGVQEPIFLAAQQGRRGLFQTLTSLAHITLAAPESATPFATPRSHGSSQRECFRIQVCAGLGNHRDLGRRRLDITDPATARWFLPNRRYSTPLFAPRQPA